MAVKRLFLVDWAGRHKIAAIVLVLALAAVGTAVSLAQLSRGDGSSKRLFETAIAAHKFAEERLESNEIVESERLCRQALESFEKLVERSDDRRYRFEQADAFETLAMIHTASLQPDQADQALRQATNGWAKLLGQDQTLVTVRERLARCLARQAARLRESSRWEEAEKVLERGIDVCQTRLTGGALDPQVERELVSLRNQLGLLCLQMSRQAEAIENFKDAVTVHKRLMQASAGASEDRELLISLLINQAKALAANKKPDAAMRVLIEARDRVERLSSEFPSTDRYRDLTATVLESEAGVFESDPNRAADARAVLERALSIRASLGAGSPPELDQVAKLAETCGRLADSYLDTKAYDRAEDYQRRELSYQTRLHEENPGVRAFRFGRGRALHNLADLLRQRGRAQEALALERKGVELLASVYRENVLDEAHRRAVSYAYWTLATLEIDRKDHRAAAKAVTEYLAIEPNGFEEASQAAGFLCRCIVLCRLDQGISAAERESLTRACSFRAIAALESAVRDGFRDFNELTASHTYDPLRDRPEFARVVHDVEAIVAALKEP